MELLELDLMRRINENADSNQQTTIKANNIDDNSTVDGENEWKREVSETGIASTEEWKIINSALSTNNDDDDDGKGLRTK